MGFREDHFGRAYQQLGYFLMKHLSPDFPDTLELRLAFP